MYMPMTFSYILYHQINPFDLKLHVHAHSLHGILYFLDLYLQHIVHLVNRLDDFGDTCFLLREAVHGESIGKAVRDILRLSSGLEYLRYVYTTCN